MSSDIRARATRQLIREAFHRLVDAGQGVTVKQLCQAAGISRVTFYAHYRDLFDLMSDDEQEALATLGLGDFADSFTRPQARAEIYLRILTYLDDHAQRYSYYFSHFEQPYFTLVLGDIRAAVSAELVRRGVFSSQEKADLCVLYHTSGLMQALRQWLNWGEVKPCTREAYARMLAEVG